MEKAANSDKKKVVAVVGAGLVGALNACFFAKRGFDVQVFESREDIRQAEVVKGRSINMTLSERGRQALKHIGMEDKISSMGVPVLGRMTHSLNGKLSAIPYGGKELYILSVERAKMHKVLLTEAETYSNTTLKFGYKLQDWSAETGQMTFVRSDGSEEQIKADLIVGCDGAFSTIRKQFLRRSRFNYSQTYTPGGYMEITMPPINGEFAMHPDYLHVWPRDSFMMIALPNPDKTFTCTLLMPFEEFAKMTTEDEVIEFFQQNFPDSIPLIGADNLRRDYFRLPPQAMVSVKCTPYHIGDKCVLMGDAGHAVVPFYGQGMNAGFEDCLVFEEIMEQFNEDFSLVLPEYTRVRVPDNHALDDLAWYNYIELGAHLNSKWFLFRRHVDNFLHFLMPHKIIPLFTMVTFTRIKYQQCVERWHWQNKMINRGLLCSALGAALGVSYLLIQQPPDVNQLMAPAEKIWSTVLAAGSLCPN